MSENLKRHFPRLLVIASLKSLRIRKMVLKEFCKDDSFVKAIREIVRNALKKNIPFTTAQKRKLVRYKDTIIALSKKRKNNKRTQQLVCQTGTGVFLPIVIPLVASLLQGLLAR